MTFKTCSKCKATKPKSEFCRELSCKDGVRPECRTCSNEATQKWRKANPEKVMKHRVQYNASHVEQKKEYSKLRF
jgi:hypothetical protein